MVIQIFTCLNAYRHLRFLRRGKAVGLWMTHRVISERNSPRELNYIAITEQQVSLPIPHPVLVPEAAIHGHILGIYQRRHFPWVVLIEYNGIYPQVFIRDDGIIYDILA